MAVFAPEQFPAACPNNEKIFPISHNHTDPVSVNSPPTHNKVQTAKAQKTSRSTLPFSSTSGWEKENNTTAAGRKELWTVSNGVGNTLETSEALW